MNGRLLFLSLVILALIAGLVVLAIQGSILAIVSLAILATVLLIGLGLSFGLMFFRMAEMSKQAAFRDNTQENLAIMQQIAKAQNLQAKGAYDHMRATKQLPEPNGHEAGLDILDGVFSDLDD